MVRIEAHLSRFACNLSGNMSIVFALSSTVILSAAGGAVDFARWTSAKSELQAQLDSAVLAGTQRLIEPGGKEALAIKVAKDHFAAAVSKRADIVKNNIGFKLNKEKTGVMSTGGASIETSLLSVVGIKSLPLLEDAASQAEFSTGGTSGGNIEISIVLDVTGSMCADGLGPCTTGSKLVGMKTAAKELVNTVVWDDQSTYTSKIAVVPFNSVVRVGPDGGGSATMAAMTGLPATWTGYTEQCVAGYESGTGTEGSTGWVCTDLQVKLASNLKVIPCVTDRYYEFGSGQFDYTDNAPGAGRWLNANQGTRSPLSLDSTDDPLTTGTGASASDPSTQYNYEIGGECWSSSLDNELMPLTNDKSALLSKIDSLVGYRWTGGVLGTAFGWYTLSPKWSSIWPAGSAPQSYSQLSQTNESGGKALRKIAVIMTDGAFNTLRGWPEEGKKDELAQATVDMCTAMKATGIEIYTVAYDLDSIPGADRDRATAMLKDCGTDVSHFYQSFNPKQLSEAFAAIGQSLSGGTNGIRLIR